MNLAFSKKKNWTKIFRVGRSDIDVHAFKNGDGRNLFLVVWKEFFYILSHPYENSLFNLVPDDILLDY